MNKGQLQGREYALFIALAAAFGQQDADFRNLAEKVNRGEQKLVDQTIEFTAYAGTATSLDMTPSGLSVSDGVRSLSENKQKAGNFFMPTHVQLLAAALSGTPTGTDAELLAGNYGHLEDLDAAAPNGVILLRNDQRIYLNRMSLWSFANKTVTDERKGTYTPKRTYIFKPESEYGIELKALKSTANAAYKLILHGIGTESA